MRKRYKLFILLVAVVILGCAYKSLQLTYNDITEKTSMNDTYHAGADQTVDPDDPYNPYMDNYVFSQLNTDEKAVYDELYQLFIEMGASKVISTSRETELNNAYIAVMADYGEIFWVLGYNYTIENTFGKTKIEVFPSYSMTKEEKEYYESQIEKEIATIDLDFDAAASDYEKAKYIFTYLTDHVTYKRESPENQNIISVFCYKQSVCMGYAAALQMLLDRVGIQSCIVTGSVYNVSHAWNLVRMDGNYYYMDATFGDSSFQNKSVKEYTNYNYFAMTTAELNYSHNTVYSYNLPVCSATEDNYYVREGLYFEDYDADQLGEILREGYENNQILSIKFSTFDLYRQFVKEFIQEHCIQNYCTGVDSFSFYTFEDQNVITFNFSESEETN